MKKNVRKKHRHLYQKIYQIKNSWRQKLSIALATVCTLSAAGPHTAYAATTHENPTQIERAAASSADVTATFTDPNFRAAVRKTLKLSANAPITQAACASVNILDVSEQGIRDLAGIEYFTGLQRLVCYENQLTSLDLTHCPYLEYLNCADNQLTSLDVSRCPNLVILFCGYNPFTNLDLRSCTKLVQLFAVNGQLTSLNLSECPLLELLACENNQLTGLDVSGCPRLSDLDCRGNNMKSVNDVKGRNSRLTGDAFIFSPQRGEKRSQSLKVSPQSLYLYAGGKGQALKVTGAKGNVTYSINKPNIASVNNKGIVTPKSKGTATITVKAAGNASYKAASTQVKVTVYAKPATVKSVKASPTKTKGTLQVSWKKVSDASGYVIRYAYKSNMAGSKTLKVPKGGTVSATIKKLASKKTVYVQVQAYSVKSGLTIPGAWSKTAKSAGKIK